MMNTTAPENQTPVERKEFKVHAAVLGHFIHSQAGSAGKAIIELIQNSIDAGATKCEIDIDRNGFTLQDDGKGFATIHEIESFFATFGTPHVEGDATFGRFRVGRGQIMGYASTVWQSNSFQMSVDIKTIGYGFDLSELATLRPGCQIIGRWYDPLEILFANGEDDIFDEDLLETLLGEIRGLVGYTNLNVTLNGTKISHDLNAEPWELETDDAYIRVKATGPLIIYNQGILVREDSGHHWGCGGVVVSKKAIKLNISRTEILRKDCPVWQRISAEVKKLSMKIRRDQNGRLDENGRIRAARELLSGSGNLKSRVVTILPREHITLEMLYNKAGSLPLIVAPDRAIRTGEKIAQSRLAVVLHPDMFYRFDCTDVAGLESALKIACSRNIKEIRDEGWTSRFCKQHVFGSYTDIVRTLLDDAKLIELNELSKDLQRIFRAIYTPVSKILCRTAHLNGVRFAPKVKIGRAENYQAWTDSRQYVAIDESLLEKILADGRKGLITLMHIMVHEACHAGDGDSRDAVHDDLFYRRFHDALMGMSSTIEYMVRKCVWNYTEVCRRDKVKPRGWSNSDFFRRRGK